LKRLLFELPSIFFPNRDPAIETQTPSRQVSSAPHTDYHPASIWPPPCRFFNQGFLKYLSKAFLSALLPASYNRQTSNAVHTAQSLFEVCFLPRCLLPTTGPPMIAFFGLFLLIFFPPLSTSRNPSHSPSPPSVLTLALFSC